MKKIFGLFAAAVLAATGLTCCGGGGGGGESSFAYKTIKITSPTSNVGAMYIRVSDPIPEADLQYNARYGFGDDTGAHTGTFKVNSQDETMAEIAYYIDDYEKMINDANAVGFYGDLVSGAERNDEGQLEDGQFPFMTVKLIYAEGSKTSGSCEFSCMFPVDDELTDEQRENLGIEPGQEYYQKAIPAGQSIFTITSF